MDGIPLSGEISKTGANRSIWVYPSIVAGIMFFGAGAIFIFVWGGHAKIRKSQTYTLYAK